MDDSWEPSHMKDFDFEYNLANVDKTLPTRKPSIVVKIKTSSDKESGAKTNRSSKAKQVTVKEPPSIIKMSIAEQLRAQGIESQSNIAAPNGNRYNQRGSSQYTNLRSRLIQDDRMFRGVAKSQEDKK